MSIPVLCSRGPPGRVAYLGTALGTHCWSREAAPSPGTRSWSRYLQQLPQRGQVRKSKKNRMERQRDGKQKVHRNFLAPLLLKVGCEEVDAAHELDRWPCYLFPLRSLCFFVLSWWTSLPRKATTCVSPETRSHCWRGEELRTRRHPRRPDPSRRTPAMA